VDLQEAEKMIRETLAENLNDPYGWKFKWGKTTTIFGSANYTERVIMLSRPMVELATREQVLDTVLHEAAHANVGAGHDHGPVWKREALRLGAKPDASTTDAPDIRARAPWVGRCEKGHEAAMRYWRKPKNRRSCRVCGGDRFDARYAITYTKEEA
jgi:predicted SprT family Zn-dependent metalloprotease